MSEPDISTLARRLAEQNNVDWRALSGSGPDGKVVERDVLDFLARVMAGEEATNPTPEPLPDGLEAWPDKDMDGVRAGVGEAASLGDLRNELGQAMKREESDDRTSNRPSAATEDHFGGVESVPMASARSTTSTGTGHDTFKEQGSEPVAVDEDIFLFDDGGADEAAGTGAVGAAQADSHAPDQTQDRTHSEPYGDAGAGASDRAGDDLDDLLVAGDEFDAETAEEYVADGEATISLETGLGESQGDGSSSFGELSAGSFDDAGDGDFLSENDADSGPAGAPGPGFGFSGDATEDSADDAPWAAPVENRPEQDWGSGIALGRGSHAASGDRGDSAAAPDLWGEPETAGHDDEGLWASTDVNAAEGAEDDLFAGHSVDEPSGIDRAAAANAWTQGESASVEGIGSWPGQESSTDTGEAEHVWDRADDVDAASHGETAEQLAPVEPEVDTQYALPDDAADLTAAASAMSSTAELPLARSAMILRRHIDLSALAASQLSVGNELGFDEPLGVAPFLLRAVAKAAGEIGVPTSHVALAALDNGLVLRRVDDAAGRSFASLIEELAGPTVAEDEPRLVAADLSGLDLDEALLDLDVPVVTLGRILYDNQRGAYRSTLALTGATQPDSGARLLARVAELLDAPVRLVL